MKFDYPYFDHHIDDSEHEKSYCFLSFFRNFIIFSNMDRERKERRTMILNWHETFLARLILLLNIIIGRHIDKRTIVRINVW